VYLPVVGSALVDRESKVSDQAKVSKYLLLARTDPDHALGELLGESGVEVESILVELLSRSREISTSTLLRGLDHSKDEIRYFAIRELIQRSELTVESATTLKEDKYGPVKAAAYRFLIERGAEIDNEDIAWKLPQDYFSRIASRNSLVRRPSPPIEQERIVLEFYRRYDADQLVRMADWDQLAGHEAYRALAIEHFPEFAERLREDLRTDFDAAAEGHYRSRLEEWRRLAATPISTTNASLLFPSQISLLSGAKQKRTKEDYQTPETIARSDVEGRKIYYIGAALVGLARNGSPEDVEFGRRFLFHNNNDVRIEAVSVIRRCGNADDVSALIKVAKSSDGLLQELACQAALELSRDQREVATEFLATGDEILVSVTVAELIAHKEKEATGDLLTRYLYDEKDKVRTRVMAFFVFRYDDQELEDLLARYTSEAVYYYDVVCCFDRVLYAPPHIRSFYRETIEDSFYGLLDNQRARA
jgi:hypothetical protein